MGHECFLLRSFVVPIYVTILCYRVAQRRLRYLDLYSTASSVVTRSVVQSVDWSLLGHCHCTRLERREVRTAPVEKEVDWRTRKLEACTREAERGLLLVVFDDEADDGLDVQLTALRLPLYLRLILRTGGPEA